MEAGGRQSADVEDLGKDACGDPRKDYGRDLWPGATEHYLPVVRKIMTDGVPLSFEDYFPNLDKHFRFTSVPLRDHFITTGTDITSIKKVEAALRESEQRPRLLGDNLPDSAVYQYLHEADGRVRFLYSARASNASTASAFKTCCAMPAPCTGKVRPSISTGWWKPRPATPAT